MPTLVRSLRAAGTGEQWARVNEIPGSLVSKSALVIRGPIGSRIAEDLVRCGVQTLTLVDPAVGIG